MNIPLFSRIRLHAQKRVPIADLVRLEGQGNYTLIHFINGKTELSARTLAVFEKRLPDFIRISRHDLINPYYISSVNIPAWRVAEVQVNGKVIPIARRRYEKVMDKIRSVLIH